MEATSCKSVESEMATLIQRQHTPSQSVHGSMEFLCFRYSELLFSISLHFKLIELEGYFPVTRQLLSSLRRLQQIVNDDSKQQVSQIFIEGIGFQFEFPI